MEGQSCSKGGQQLSGCTLPERSKAPNFTHKMCCAGFKLVYRRTTGEETVPTGHSMAFGAVSGLLAATATFPVETVR